MLSRKMHGGKAISLCEVIGWENSRKHSDTNYTVYALRFMSLTRQVFVVCAHRIWGALGKDLSLSCRHNSLLPCCKSSGGRGASSIQRANLKACRTWGWGGSEKVFCNQSLVHRTRPCHIRKWIGKLCLWKKKKKRDLSLHLPHFFVTLPS